METESWRLFAVCGSFHFYLLWKLGGKRIQSLMTSTCISFKGDSQVCHQVCETQNQKDRKIAPLAETISALNNTQATIKGFGEENLSLSSFLKAGKVSHEDPEPQTEEVRANTSDLRQEIEGLKQELQRAEEKGKDLNAQIPALKWEIQGLNAKCAGQEKRYEELTQLNASLKEEIKELKHTHQAECVARVKEKLSLQFEIEELKRQYRNAEGEVEHLTMELRAVPTNFSEYKRKAEQWKCDLKIANRRIESEKEILKYRLQASVERVHELETMITTEIQQKRPPQAGNEMECVICYALRKCVLLRPCMHACVCRQCSLRVDRCPLCTAVITKKELVFL